MILQTLVYMAQNRTIFLFVYNYTNSNALYIVMGQKQYKYREVHRVNVAS